MLQNHRQWHTEIAPTTSSKKINSIEEVDLSAKIDTLLAHLNKQNLDNVPLNELVANNDESVDVTSLGTTTIMGLETTTIIIMLGHLMFQAITTQVVVTLMIWKTL